MTNKEAASIIKIILRNRAEYAGRGNGKSASNLFIDEAFMKAVYVLENTPDKAMD